MNICKLTHPQFTGILKVIIENAQSGDDLRGIDIISTLLRMAIWITRFHDPASFRLKIKFCALCDSFMDQPGLFAARRDSAARIGIADCIVDWAQDLAGVSYYITNQRLLRTDTTVD